jgi:hypothetical protein
MLASLPFHLFIIISNIDKNGVDINNVNQFLELEVNDASIFFLKKAWNIAQQ